MLDGKSSMRAGWMVGALAVIGLSGCAKIDAGHGGVLWTAWSGTQEDLYTEGWYFVAPWNKMISYNVRTQDRPEQLHVLTNNGLSMALEASVRYRARIAMLPQLHKNIGPDYYDVLIAPSIRSAARKVVGRYTPEQVYSTKREEVEHEILTEVGENLKVAVRKKFQEAAAEGKAGREEPALGAAAEEFTNPIELMAILVRNVDLPEKLKRAINDKLEEEQRALKMEFTLNRESQEAKRKGVEAKGIAERNRIITESINDKLLRYEGIQATERLANSSNSKVVVIGAGKEGLPLILGGQ